MAFLAAIPAAFATLATASTATTAAVAAASVTLAETTALIGAVGAGVAGYSAYKQNQFQAAVAKNNATIAANNSQAALMTGSAAEGAARLASGRRIGMALAAEGANGVDVSFGSPQEVNQGLKATGDLDALTIRHNAAVNALGYAQQSAGFTAEASMDKQAAAGALVGGALNIGSSFIGGASSIAGKAAAFRQAGATPSIPKG